MANDEDQGPEDEVVEAVVASIEGSTRWMEYLPLSRVVPADANPKKHDDARIRKSVGRFGYVEPITMDERTGKLVAGHGRLEALATMQAEGQTPPDGIVVQDGEWCVPVTRGWSSRSDDEADAYLIASNQLVTAGGWDDSGLSEMLNRVSDPHDLGFTDNELDSFMAALGATDFLSEFGAPAPPEGEQPPESTDEQGNVTLRTKRQGDNAHVTVIMSFAERDEVIGTLKRAKAMHGLQTTAEALLLVVRGWGAAHPDEA